METDEKIKKELEAGYAPQDVDYRSAAKRGTVGSSSPTVQQGTYAPVAVDYSSEARRTSETITVKPVSPLPDTTIKPSESNLDPFIGVNRLPQGSVKLGQFLGKGAFGQVYQGQWDERVVALKEIEVKLAQEKLGISKMEVLEALQWEVSRLSTSSHPNLVQFYGIYQFDGKTYLVMDFCENGNLQSVLKKKGSSLDWSSRWQWALEMAQGLAYLHHEGMLHRDLKAENILLDRNNRALLADLGVAQVDALLQQKEASVVEKGYQDQRFIAPEALTQSSPITAATDIYALGLVFWQLVSGGQDPRRPKDGNELLAWMKNGERGCERETIPADCPIEFKTLILDCWQLEPQHRPNAETIVRRLRGLANRFHVMPDWINSCEQIETLVHPKRLEILKYVPPFLTEGPVIEDLDIYWGRFDENGDVKRKEDADKITNPPLILKEILEQFLINPRTTTLVLLGEAGLGKTLSTYQFAEELLIQWWQKFKDFNKNTSNKQYPYLPIFIRPALPHWSQSELKNGLEKTLKYLNVSTIPKNTPLLFIIDGYDECFFDETPKSLPLHLGLNHWPNAKLLVTSRPNTVPREVINEHFGQPDRAQFRYFLPFNINQTLGYLKDSIQEQEIFDNYKKKLEESKGLREVLRNPFVLKLFVDSFTTVSKKGFNLSRWDIYQSVVEHWIDTCSALLTTDIQNILKGSYPTLLDSFNAFAAEVAFTVYQKKTLILEQPLAKELSESSHLWLSLTEQIQSKSRQDFARRQESLTPDKQRRALLGEEDYVAIMLLRLNQFKGRSPLQNKSNHQEFSHKSFFEFYVAKRIVELRTKNAPLIIAEGLRLLNHHPIQSEPEILHFIGEAWAEEQSKNLIEPFFQIMESSIESSNIIQASANAATILIAGSIPFSGRNLNRVRLDGADLSYGIFDGTKFQKAGLSRVKFNGAHLGGTDFNGAIMNEAQFGEFPDLKLAQIRTFCYSPRGNLLAALMGNNIIIFNVNTQEEISILDGSQAIDVLTLVKSVSIDSSMAPDERDQRIKRRYFPSSIVFGPDQLQLASGNRDGTIRLWSVANGAYEKILDWGDLGETYNVAYSPDGKQLASIHADNSIRLWDVGKGILLKTIKDKGSCLAYSPDGLLLASTSNKTIKLWDVASGTCQKILEDVDIVARVIFSPNGLQLASSNTHNIRLWDITTGTCQKVLTHLRSRDGKPVDFDTISAWFGFGLADRDDVILLSIAYSPDGLYLSSLTRKNVRVWDTVNGTLLKVFEGLFSGPVSFNPNGSQLATVQCFDRNGDEKPSLKFWDVKDITKGIYKKTTDWRKDFDGVIFSINGLRLASYSGNEITLWNAKNGTQLKTIKSNQIRNVIFNSDAEKLVSHCVSGVTVLDINTNKLNRYLEGINLEGIISLDPNTLQLACGNKGKMQVWDIIRGTLISEALTEGDISSMTFSPDGLLLAYSEANGKIVLWNIKQKTHVQTFTGHKGSVSYITFSEDGKKLASLSNDDKIKLWDIIAGRCYMEFDSFEETTKIGFITTEDQMQALIMLRLNGAVAFRNIETGTRKDTGAVHTCYGGLDGIRDFHYIKTEQKSLLAMCVDGARLDCWRIKSRPDNEVYLQPLWSSHQMTLMAANANLTNVAGLSESNIILLRQRGAIGNPRLANEPITFSPSFDNKKKELNEVRQATYSKAFQGHVGRINCIQLLGNEEFISGSDDQTIKVWNKKIGQCVKTLRGHMGSITCMQLLSDVTLITGSSDSTIKIWDLRNGNCLKTLQGHTSSVRCLQLLSSEELVTGSNDKSIKIWNLQTGNCVSSLVNWHGSIDSLQLLQKDELLVSSRSQIISLDLKDVPKISTLMEVGEYIKNASVKYRMFLNGHTNTVPCLQLLPNGELASGSTDRSIRVWHMNPSQILPSGVGTSKDSERGECIRVLRGHTDEVNDIEYLSKTKLVSCASDNSIKIWSWETGNCLTTLYDNACCLKATPNDQLLSGSQDGTIKLWNLLELKLEDKLEGRSNNEGCCVLQ